MMVFIMFVSQPCANRRSGGAGEREGYGRARSGDQKCERGEEQRGPGDELERVLPVPLDRELDARAQEADPCDYEDAAA